MFVTVWECWGRKGGGKSVWVSCVLMYLFLWGGGGGGRQGRQIGLRSITFIVAYTGRAGDRGERPRTTVIQFTVAHTDVVAYVRSVTTANGAERPKGSLKTRTEAEIGVALSLCNDRRVYLLKKKVRVAWPAPSASLHKRHALTDVYRLKSAWMPPTVQ